MKLRMATLASFTILSILFIILAFPFDSFSSSVEMRDVRILYNEKDVVVYGVLSDSFTKEMKSAIMAGIPATFTYTLKTHEEVAWWFDKEISRITIKHTIKYDNVKQNFSVSLADNKEPAIFQDFEAAKRAMSELSGVAIMPLSNLVKNRTYYVMIKAKLEKYRPQSSMRYIFFFSSPGDFETAWSPKQRFVH